jgi:hypothetical protein
MTWKQEEELAAKVSAAFEPNPPATTAREARRETPGFVWVSCHDFNSPGGWWKAEIGTDHGPESEDDSPVRWRSALELSQIEDAWRIVEELKARGWLAHVLAMVDGWVVNARRYELRTGRWDDGANVMSTTDMVQEIGDEAGEAIANAAVAAMAKVSPPAPVGSAGPDGGGQGKE